MDTRRFTLDGRANAYIARKLEDGNGLGRQLAARVPITNGSVHTFMPGEANDALYRFDDGGLVPDGLSYQRGDRRSVRVNSIDEPVAEEINSELRALANGVCVFEDAVRGRRDPWVLAHSRWPLAFAGDGVLHILYGDQATRDIVLEMMRAARNWMTIGALCVPSVSPSERDRAELSDESLADWSQGASMILLGAYDGEGWLIWQPG